MGRVGLFPGTFDPVTRGHVDIIDRALQLFDQLVIGIGVNAEKKPMFPIERRLAWFRQLDKDRPAVSVFAYEGLTVEFCKKVGAGFILRGIRYAGDFEYEKAIADMNRRLDGGIDTVLLTASPELSTLASTLVRDIIRHGGDARPFLPAVVADDLQQDHLITV